jgi:hypothetical protein
VSQRNFALRKAQLRRKLGADMRSVPAEVLGKRFRPATGKFRRPCNVVGLIASFALAARDKKEQR